VTVVGDGCGGFAVFVFVFVFVVRWWVDNQCTNVREVPFGWSVRVGLHRYNTENIHRVGGEYGVMTFSTFGGLIERIPLVPPLIEI